MKYYRPKDLEDLYREAAKDRITHRDILDVSMNRDEAEVGYCGTLDEQNLKPAVSGMRTDRGLWSRNDRE